MKKAAQQSLHKSRWHEDWCVGGARPVAGGPDRALRRWMGMPQPSAAIVFGSRPLDLLELGVELTWRTKMSENIAYELGVPADAPFRERAALGGAASPDSGALWRLAATICGPDNLPRPWHSSSLWREMKHLLSRLESVQPRPQTSAALRITRQQVGELGPCSMHPSI